MSQYANAGVDLNASDSVKKQIGELIASTYGEGVVSKGGEFGGLFRLPGSGQTVVASVDGVGTKLKVAFMAKRHDSIGEDLVNHCVNDIAVMGANPLFFLDYLATGRIPDETILQIVQGIVRGCKNHGMAVLGGETAQMPGFYIDGEYDLAGSIFGIVEDSDALPRYQEMKSGDFLVGFRSNGLHTNGYSLARDILFARSGLSVDDRSEELGTTWGEELLRVHRSYFQEIRYLIDERLVSGLAHITGGGIRGNLSRVLPEDLTAKVDVSKIEIPPVFRVVREFGGVDPAEMFDVFNMGIGLIAVSPSSSVDAILQRFPNDAVVLGELFPGGGREEAVVLEGIS